MAITRGKSLIHTFSLLKERPNLVDVLQYLILNGQNEGIKMVAYAKSVRYLRLRIHTRCRTPHLEELSQ